MSAIWLWVSPLCLFCTLQQTGKKNDVYSVIDGMEGDKVDDPESIFHGKRMRNGSEEFRSALDL